MAGTHAQRDRGVRQAAESGVPLRPGAEAKERIVAGAVGASVRAAIAAGVKIAMGTDATVSPHGKNLRELELLVEHGMTPAQALHAATGSAAQLMGLDGESGTLEPGKRADVVVADGALADVTGLGERVQGGLPGRCAGRRRPLSAPRDARASPDQHTVYALAAKEPNPRRDRRSPRWRAR